MFALVEQRTFCKVDFVDTTDGHVRIRSPLTHELTEMMPRRAQALARIAKHVAHTFGRLMEVIDCGHSVWSDGVASLPAYP